MSIKKYSSLINFIAFQAGWFASVFGAAKNLGWLGPLLVLFIVPLQIYFLTEERRAEIIFAITCGLLGFLLETAMISGNVYFIIDRRWNSICPPWMAGLWFNFAPLVCISLRWLKGRYFLSGILGGIFGPIAYWGGEKLGALTIADIFLQGYFPLALLWAIIFPGLIFLHENLTRKRL